MLLQVGDETGVKSNVSAENVVERNAVKVIFARLVTATRGNTTIALIAAGTVLAEVVVVGMLWVRVLMLIFATTAKRGWSRAIRFFLLNFTLVEPWLGIVYMEASCRYER